ncbi:glycoside hydrolase family 3 C-terminal domain-containing protein [Sphingobacterium sp. lm-10]|uniref:beta-glucosidase n=1 Tax=Sphingobacterium sp. lm-10 TaxID=2944904 RepID=UPI0020218F84|nr:glycoside hydrolase family 3 C-terminal domain-containing protein [Sphingobacterium sp. lm-10]MCL7986680.1 glycoside hydrolase family 3 C-terminal domain-containing protein [Sphingobacterium sp. lm-10]
MRRICAFATLMLGMLFTQCKSGNPNYEHLFQNPDLSVDERVENLLSLLTLEEKVGLMMNSSKAVPRLGIPAYDWWNEALHGVARAGKATVFPQAIGMAASWNEESHLKTFEIISDEARAKFNKSVEEGERGRYYGLSFWTPNINIFRDPRWGRGQETYGEDPYLTTRLGLAAVKGLQGEDDTFFKSHACAKHFAVHSGPEWNRHSYDAVVSKRDLWETYLPAFEALVKEGNVQEVMCAYNAFEGEPCCGSNTLLIDILRNKWDFKGMVVSDCWAINDFYEKAHHETHESPAAAAADAVITSTDLECGSTYENLLAAVQDGLISEEQINTSLRRILRGWITLGLFDPKGTGPWDDLPYSIVASAEHRQQSLDVARQSMTLLKNENNTLPLNKDIKRIAVIGANAADSLMLWGNYNGTPTSTVTILEGIRRKLPNAEVIYEKGSDLVDPWVRSSLYSSFQTAQNGEKGLQVEFFNNNKLEGKPARTLNNDLGIEYSNRGGTALAQNVNMENTSTRISGVFVAPYTGEVVFKANAYDGYVLTINGKEVAKKSGESAIQGEEYTMQVEKGKSYPVVMEHRQLNKINIIGFSVYKKEKAAFSALTVRLKDVDAIVYVGGLSPQLEGEEMFVDFAGFKGGDRTSIDLPNVQRDLLAALRNTGKPVTFVLCTGSSLALAQDEKNYDALLCAWYGGEEAGTAVADVLFGDYNPAGRLPVTFYKTLAQLDGGLTQTGDAGRQGFENYDMQGRTYRYMQSEPLYAFGHGLSYSQFNYGEIDRKDNKVAAKKGLQLAISLTNTSSMDGEEVVQVYVKRLNDPDAPVKSLRAFSRVPVKAMQRRSITLNLSEDAFKFYDEATDDVRVKPGKYHILYGGSSKDAQLKKLEIDVI